MWAKNLSQLVGNTPLVELPGFSYNDKVTVLAKLEGNNPGGSVKDRAAFSMITAAEKRGDLQKGVRLIEPTSGNTGIALAMIAATRGYEIELVMPENSSKERVQTMRSYGARVTLTAADKSMEGAIDYVKEKSQNSEYLFLNQFGNADNKLAHYKTTGPELYRDTDRKITHFVSAMGTTGTIMGTSMFLKEQNPAIQIVGAQPAQGARIPGIRRWPKEYMPSIFEPERVDTILDVTQEQAEQTAKKLSSEYGIFCGISSGGAAYLAQKVANEIDSGVVVFIVCDRGDRYLSTGVFT